MVNSAFWQGKTVFLTGHTGFKGSWLSLWLHTMGAKVIGYALPPPTQPNLFATANLAENVTNIIGDVRDFNCLQEVMRVHQPDMVIHMAAQSLVRYSYHNPIETYATNVMGTVHLLESVRKIGSVRVIINVTSDKCYENQEWVWGYRENEPLGGYDPYSNSKGCAELVTMAFRNSFFHAEDYVKHKVALASVRAGNVIGGGDWAADRLIPDIMRAFLAQQPAIIRNPHAIRPWQHVLEPLSGYLLLAQKLWEEGTSYAEGWNFGPSEEDAKPVQWIVEQLVHKWGNNASWKLENAGHHLHEANYLKLDCSKAKAKLGWYPRWNLEKALSKTIDWYLAYQQGKDTRNLMINQIETYNSVMDN